jgi:hypothetical protein
MKLLKQKAQPYTVTNVLIAVVYKLRDGRYQFFSFDTIFPRYLPGFFDIDIFPTRTIITTTRLLIFNH